MNYKSGEEDAGVENHTHDVNIAYMVDAKQKICNAFMKIAQEPCGINDTFPPSTAELPVHVCYQVYHVPLYEFAPKLPNH